MSAVYLFLGRKSACGPAMLWVRRQPSETPEYLWQACPDPEWMAWLIQMMRLTPVDPAMPGLEEAWDALRLLSEELGDIPDYERVQYEPLGGWSLEEMRLVEEYRAAQKRVCDAYRASYACPQLPPEQPTTTGPIAAEAYVDEDDDLPF